MSQLPRDSRPQVALAGRSNVGKSTLLNRLVGEKHLAKVSSTPGKTRSLNFFMINNRFYLVDLPGYGFAKVSRNVRNAWTRLIETYLTGSNDLTGLVLLLDVRREVTEEDRLMLDWLGERGLPALAVVTKVDKVTRDVANRKVQRIEQELQVPAMAFSAVSGVGKSDLVGSIDDLISAYTRNKG